MKGKIIQDVDFIHSNTGVLIGTVVLILLWLVLGADGAERTTSWRDDRQSNPSAIAVRAQRLSVLGLARTSNRQQCEVAGWQQCFKALRHNHDPRRHVGAEPIGPRRHEDQTF